MRRRETNRFVLAAEGKTPEREGGPRGVGTDSLGPMLPEFVFGRTQRDGLVGRGAPPRRRGRR